MTLAQSVLTVVAYAACVALICWAFLGPRP